MSDATDTTMDDPTGGPDEAESDASGPSPALKSSLLWGAVGGLSFLVLAQGYVLLDAGTISPAIMVGGAIVVALGATVLTYLSEERIAGE